jgi:hypothetical protein
MGIFSNTDFKGYSAPSTVVVEDTSANKNETNVKEVDK